MLKIVWLQLNPDTDIWSGCFSSDLAYTVMLEVPTKWAEEVIKNGNFVKTSNEWLTYKPSE